mmetsp:Transcript_18962/g.34231  ORF Transcript_18962/g.34231 Transcript_18962/m.34231 type:complete len:363 (+) Transcript_18962:112-1200(+)
MQHLKYFLLLSLLLQNTSYVLTLRYSQGVLKESYSIEECLLLGEWLKMAVALVVVLREHSPSDAHGCRKVWWVIRNSQKMLVLAIVYLLQNILSYTALRHIDAAAFTVLGQLKILTTAAFSMLVLRRRISWGKWRALIVIVCGVVLVTSPSLANCRPETTAMEEEEPEDDDDATEPMVWTLTLQESLSLSVGYGAMLCQVTLSGLASIYFEKTIKSQVGEQLSLWQRNFQLAMFSIVLYLGILLGKVRMYGHVVLQGWSVLACIVSLLGALGGLLVSFSVKYTDSITKSIAVSGSIVLSSCFGYVFLDGPMTLPMVVGCIATIVATQSYSFDIDPDPGVPEKVASTSNLMTLLDVDSLERSR